MKSVGYKALSSSKANGSGNGAVTHNAVAHLRNIDELKFGWIPNNLFTQRYARQLGPYCTSIYAYLAYRADNTTQECWPSIKTISTETGIGESKVVESVKELEAWRIILVKSKYTLKKGGAKQWHNNVYVLLHPSSWRTEATFRSAKGKTIIKKLDTESESSGSEPVIEIRGVAQDYNPRSAPLGGIPGEPGTILREPVVSRPGDHDGMPSSNELDSCNKIHSNADSDNKTKKMNECPPSLSLRDRALLLLLRMVAPDYNSPEKVVPGLSTDRFDLVGAVALYYLARRSELKKLTNPAGYFHSVMKAAPREDGEGISGLPHDLEIFTYDWDRYHSLYQRVYGGNSNPDVERKLSCLLKSYGIISDWTKAVMQLYPCGDRDWDDDSDLDDELDGLDDDLEDDSDLDEEIPF